MFPLLITYNIIYGAENIPFTIPIAMVTCLATRLNHYYDFYKKPASHTNVAYTAIRNELLYSGFVLPDVQIFFVQKISFATFGVSIDDFLRDTLVWATAYVHQAKQEIIALYFEFENEPKVYNLRSHFGVSSVFTHLR